MTTDMTFGKCVKAILDRVLMPKIAVSTVP